MGAGGGMWASAREELRRPGLSGGGGGKPLFACTGLGGTIRVNAAGTVVTSGAFLLAASGKGLANTLRTGLTTGLAATLAAGFVTCLTGALAEGLAAAFSETLALAGGALATGLEAGFFKTGLALTTGVAGFLAMDLPAALKAVLGTNLGSAAVLTIGLLAAAVGALAAFLAMEAGLLITGDSGL